MPSYVVIRRYKGAVQFMDELVKNRSEVERLIRGVKGFQAYYAVRSEDGDASTITVCDDRAGVEESTRKAAEWVAQNMKGLAGSTPEVVQGEGVISFWK